MVLDIWAALPDHYAGVRVDAVVIMPNHLHGILILTRKTAGHMSDGASIPESMPLTLPDVVHRLKSLTTRRYIEGVRAHGWTAFHGRLWQRNYFERIIRDDGELMHTQRYIAMNPAQWTVDRENPANR